MVTSLLLLLAIDPALADDLYTSDYLSLQDALDDVGNNDVLIIDGDANGDALAPEGTVTARSRDFTIRGGDAAGAVLEYNWNGTTINLPPGSDVTIENVQSTCTFTGGSFQPALIVEGTVRFQDSKFECFTDGVMSITNGGSLQPPANGKSNSVFQYNNNVVNISNADEIILSGMEFNGNYREGLNANGAIAITNAARVEVVDMLFQGNSGAGGSGGALYLGNVASVLIERSTFQYNYNLFFSIDLDDEFDTDNEGDGAGFILATGRGAGLYIDGSGDFDEEVEILGNVFDGNLAWEGGGLYLNNIRYANLYNNLFAANWAYHLGGGMVSWVGDRTDPWGEDYRWPAEASEAPGYDLIPADDVTPGDGGGGGVFGDGHKVVNNTFVLNTGGITMDPETVVVVGGGGGALFHGHRPDFRNNIVSHSHYGGGVLLHEGVNFQQGDDLNWEYNMFYWNCDVAQCMEDAIIDQRNVTSNGEESGYTLHPNNIVETDPLFYYVGDIRDDVIDFDAYPDVYCTDYESLAVRGGDPLEEQESSLSPANTGAPYSDIGMCGGQLAHLYWNADRDGDGFEQFYDCLDEPDEDESIETFPGANEDCDFEDNDCDGTIDEGFVTTWWPDEDGDGYGDEGQLPDLVCPDQAPVDYVSVGGDCDDQDVGANEGEVEICDGKDNDCDGIADQGELEYVTVYRDTDGDTWGALSAPREACFSSSEGIYYEAVGTESYPLAGGSTAWVTNAQDCDDSDPTVSPDAVEDCTIADRNCNGDSYDADGAPEYFIDLDGDGYGEGNVGFGTNACEQDQLPDLAEGTWVPNGGDCNEATADVNPGAAETCDGFDNDCDNRIDVDPEDAQLLYEDYDNDGFGNPATAIRSCDPGPTYTTSKGGDCDDSDPTVGECSECGCQATPSPAGSGAMLVLLGSLLGLRRRRS